MGQCRTYPYLRPVDALRSAPAGSRGLVHRVMLSFSRVGYVYEGLVARCRIDPADGVEWDELPSPFTWTGLAPMFTDPPEAITTGLVDFQVHRERLEQIEPSSPTDRR